MEKKTEGASAAPKKVKQTSYDIPELQTVNQKPQSGPCMCVKTASGADVWYVVRGKVGQKPLVDFNCGDTFSPDADLSALSIKMWDVLCYPLGFK